jgi:excisionase family DNA binding protein
MRHEMDSSEILKPLSGPTMSVPEAGSLLGLSRNKAYEAAKSGQIPALRFGRKLVVPTMAVREMLGMVA